MPVWCIPASLDLEPNEGTNTKVDLTNLNGFWSTLDRANVISIGELDHRDGSSIALKAHLIEEFATRYDSLIIALEYGIATIDQIKYAVEFENDTLEYRFANFMPGGVASNTRGQQLTSRVLHRIKQEKKGAFDYYGIDVLESVGSLKQYIRRVLPEDSSIGRPNRTSLDRESVAESFTKNWFWRPLRDENSEKRFYSSLNPTQNQRLADSILGNVILTEFEKQVFKSLRYHEEVQLLLATIDKVGNHTSPEVSILRDSIMAENLLYLAAEYPNHKILCSASNFHIAKDLKGVYKKNIGDVKVMGEYLEEVLGDKYISIPIIRFNGASGFWRYNTPGQYEKVVKKSKRSIEFKLAQKCNEVGFVSFSGTPTDFKFRMHATMDKEASYEWSKAYDGAIFIHTMQTDVRFGYPHRVGLNLSER